MIPGMKEPPEMRLDEDAVLPVTDADGQTRYTVFDAYGMELVVCDTEAEARRFARFLGVGPSPALEAFTAFAAIIGALVIVGVVLFAGGAALDFLGVW